MSLYVLSLLLMALEGPLEFGEAVTLASVSENSDLFVEEPLSFDFDEAGNFYLLDSGAKTVFTWDKQGRYTGNLGKAGQGPGELVLSGRGPTSGFLTTFQGKMYLMDGRKREIMVFKDRTFEKALPLRLARGRVMNFAILSEERFLFHWRRFGEDKMLNELVIVDAAGATVEVIDSQVDTSFQMRGTGSNRSFKIKAYNPAMVSSYNRATGEMLMGNSGEASFQVVDKSGKKTSIRVPIPQMEVTREDKEEFKKQFTSGRFQPELEFPDKKTFYSHLISLGEKGFLVYDQSSFDRNVNGVHLSRDGKLKGRFSMALGQQGGLFASAGRVLAVSLDEDDDFVLRELKID